MGEQGRGAAWPIVHSVTVCQPEFSQWKARLTFDQLQGPVPMKSTIDSGRSGPPVPGRVSGVTLKGVLDVDGSTMVDAALRRGTCILGDVG